MISSILSDHIIEKICSPRQSLLQTSSFGHISAPRQDFQPFKDRPGDDGCLLDSLSIIQNNLFPDNESRFFAFLYLDYLENQ